MINAFHRYSKQNASFDKNTINLWFNISYKFMTNNNDK